MTAVLDAGAGGGLRLGLVVLSTDETLEFEARQVLSGRAVNLLHNRIYSDHAVTPEGLRAMERRLRDAVTLLPQELAAVGYGCTSASVFIGPDTVTARVREVHADVPVVNPISAVVAGLRVLAAKKIALITPYTAQVAAPMRAFLEARGIMVVREVSFGEEDDRRVARISEGSTFDTIRAAVAAGEVDAVFASCTNLRTFGIIEAAERAIGVPVISSNQALIWDLLRQAKVDARGWGPGRLFETGVNDDG
ncbi:maleate cis-trans isomerase family protein [Roseovarius aestuariivivens]|uniref:maleate cis-trans isomerase family protein n=1 Tax=Roseovarius aestuariivivens TaxID=1888910 RepID=UPI0010803A12|nr:aspartate/glutamate racemase family protein [Roseovarius aestuariivivens]